MGICSPPKMNLLYNAGSIPSALMYGALNEQDMLCQPRKVRVPLDPRRCGS
jgi:hypothetical protein